MTLLINKYVIFPSFFNSNTKIHINLLNNLIINKIMNKTELIDAMAADAGISKAAAKKALESLMGSVSGTLKNCLLYTTPRPRD